VRLSGTLALVKLIEPAQKVALHSGDFRGILLLGAQVQHRRTGRAKARALKNGREKAGLPIFHTVHRQTERIVQDNVSGQVLAFAAEAVTDPRAESGVAG